MAHVLLAPDQCGHIGRRPRDKHFVASVLRHVVCNQTGLYICRTQEASGFEYAMGGMHRQMNIFEFVVAIGRINIRVYWLRLIGAGAGAGTGTGAETWLFHYKIIAKKKQLV